MTQDERQTYINRSATECEKLFKTYLRNKIKFDLRYDWSPVLEQLKNPKGKTILNELKDYFDRDKNELPLGRIMHVIWTNWQFFEEDFKRYGIKNKGEFHCYLANLTRPRTVADHASAENYVDPSNNEIDDNQIKDFQYGYEKIKSCLDSILN